MSAMVFGRGHLENWTGRWKKKVYLFCNEACLYDEGGRWGGIIINYILENLM